MGARERWGTGCIAVAHDVRSMHNVGAIFRTADGAGFCAVVLSGISGAPPDPRIAKVALGAETALPHVSVSSMDDLLAVLEGAFVVLVEQHPRAVAVGQVEPSRDLPVAVVVCGEITGAPARLVQRADVVAEIPMFGTKESLNVSVAFGIAAYHVALQRRAADQGLQAARGRRPVRDGVLTTGVTQGQTPTRRTAPVDPSRGRR